MSEDHLIVHYRMTLSDWSAFNLYHFYRSAVIWRVWAALVYFTAKGQLHSTPGISSLGHIAFVGLAAAVTVSVVYPHPPSGMHSADNSGACDALPR
jgi:hypothetical protein